MAIASINPATGEKLREFAPHTDVEIEKTLRQAAAAERSTGGFAGKRAPPALSDSR